MERIQLVRSERTRELSRMNNSLYEFLLPSEARPAQDNVVNHAVIKADVRGSSRITQDLLARGLNPATLFSMNFYEPVKRILDRYGAAKVFIEGDAMILAIFETESNRSNQRAVSKACALARQILAISGAYNERPDTADLPRLELGVGDRLSGFRADLLGGQRFAHHDFARAESFRSTVELLEGRSPHARRQIVSVPALRLSARYGGRARRRNRRISDSVQPERR